MKKLFSLLFCASLLTATISLPLIVGCKTANGSDAVLVNSQRVEESSLATFKFVLQVDNQDRGFWRVKAPAFHEFCNGLRAPTPYPPGSQTMIPQYRAAIVSLDDVRLAYKAGKATGSDVQKAVSVLSELVNQAAAWSTIVTNRSN